MLRTTAFANKALRISRSAARLASSDASASEVGANKEIMKYLSTPPYTLPNHKKVVSPPMVYIGGEEMTHYTMSLM